MSKMRRIRIEKHEIVGKKICQICKKREAIKKVKATCTDLNYPLSTEIYYCEMAWCQSDAEAKARQLVAEMAKKFTNSNANDEIQLN